MPYSAKLQFEHFKLCEMRIAINTHRSKIMYRLDDGRLH
jgi:hypothetical protein